jgi:hypothetical protein
MCKKIKNEKTGKRRDPTMFIWALTSPMGRFSSQGHTAQVPSLLRDPDQTNYYFNFNFFFFMIYTAQSLWQHSRKIYIRQSDIMYSKHGRSWNHCDWSLPPHWFKKYGYVSVWDDTQEDIPLLAKHIDFQPYWKSTHWHVVLVMGCWHVGIKAGGSLLFLVVVLQQNHTGQMV